MKALAWTVGAVLVALGAAANAGSLTWDFSFAATLGASGTDSGSGVITTPDTLTSGTLLSGTYTITGVTGTVTGVSGAPSSNITGVIAADGFLGNDNLLLVPTATQPFDSGGLSFTLLNGVMINLWGDGTHIYECTSAVPTACDNAADSFQTTSFSISANGTPVPVPLPESLSLLGLGLVGLGVFARFARGQLSVGLAA
jgi:hypothetical protein